MYATVAKIYDQMDSPSQKALRDAIASQLSHDLIESLQVLTPGLLQRDDQFQQWFLSQLKRAEGPWAFGRVVDRIMRLPGESNVAEWERLRTNIPAPRPQAWKPWLRHYGAAFIAANQSEITVIAVQVIGRALNRLWPAAAPTE